MRIYTNHELSEIIPCMDDAQYLELKEDISKKGLLTPIVIWEGKILDGRHRYRACQELGIEPTFKDFHVNGIGPLDFVISHNLARRHLSEAQRAAIAVTLKDSMLWKKRATPNMTPLQTRAVVAKAMKVGTTAVAKASVVKARSPEGFKRIMEGKSSVDKEWKQVRTQTSDGRGPKISTLIQSEELIDGLANEGWLLESRRIGGKWICHFFGNGVPPLAGDQWAMLGGRELFLGAVQQASKKIEHLAYV